MYIYIYYHEETHQEKTGSKHVEIDHNTSRRLNQRMDSSSVSQLLGAGAVGAFCAFWERSPRVFNNSPHSSWNFIEKQKLA